MLRYVLQFRHEPMLRTAWQRTSNI